LLEPSELRTPDITNTVIQVDSINPPIFPMIEELKDLQSQVDTALKQQSELITNSLTLKDPTSLQSYLLSQKV